MMNTQNCAFALKLECVGVRWIHIYIYMYIDAELCRLFMGRTTIFILTSPGGVYCRVDVEMSTALVVFGTIDSIAKCGVCGPLFDSAWGWCAVRFFYRDIRLRGGCVEATGVVVPRLGPKEYCAGWFPWLACWNASVCY
jgi:hypothetical protein